MNLEVNKMRNNIKLNHFLLAQDTKKNLDGQYHKQNCSQSNGQLRGTIRYVDYNMAFASFVRFRATLTFPCFYPLLYGAGDFLLLTKWRCCGVGGWVARHGWRLGNCRQLGARRGIGLVPLHGNSPPMG